MIVEGQRGSYDSLYSSSSSRRVRLDVVGRILEAGVVRREFELSVSIESWRMNELWDESKTGEVRPGRSDRREMKEVGALRILREGGLRKIQLGID